MFIPNPSFDIPPGVSAYLSSGQVYVLKLQKLRDTSFMHDSSYDNQCFLEISRTPQGIFVLSFFKASFTVVTTAPANSASSGFYLIKHLK